MSAAVAARASDVAAAIGSRLDARPLAIMLDVDGTLAPIAPRPEEARVPEETRRVLASLAGLPGVHLALVSGRAAADAARMVGLDGAWVLGNHGMEITSPDGQTSADPAAARYESAIASVAAEVDRVAARFPGAFVENKRWTLSVHYRLVGESSIAALVADAGAVARAAGLRTSEGKMVLEIRPPVDVNKGTAAVALAERLGAVSGGAVLFAGDDRTDEDAFRALRARLAAAVTIRVGEMTETAAEFRLDGPDALRELLASIARRARG